MKLKVRNSRRGHSENEDITVGKMSSSSSLLLQKTTLKQDHQQKAIKVRGSSMPEESMNQLSQKLQEYQKIQHDQKNKEKTVDHKEIIINHIRKYIKVGGKMVGQAGRQDSPDVIIQNLREFLNYLENKNIINPQKLSDQEEMKSLIKDILKLDLSKFSKPRRNNSQPSKNRSSHHQKG